MKIYIKVGTMPAVIMHLCNKRKDPKIGDQVKLKEREGRWEPKINVLIDDIVETGNDKLFLAQRW